MKRLSLLFLALLNPITHAQSTLSDTNIDRYRKGMREIVRPWFDAQGTESEFVGQKGVRIRYKFFKNESGKGSITVVNGASETYYKYAEVAYDLFQAGYSVFLIDHRGQGRSGRMLQDRYKQHVDSFDNFVSDLKFYHDNVVRFMAKGPRFLLAHSMGGCISTLYMEMYPGDFKAAALLAPMHKIKIEKDGEIVHEGLTLVALARRVLWDRAGEEYATAPKDPFDETFERDALTHSYARWEMGQDVLFRNPTLRVKGVTNNWLREAVSTSIAVRQFDWARAIETPILLLQAERESLLLNEGQNEFCQNARTCKLEVVRGAKHEILMETNSIRTPALKRVLDFFAEHG